MPAANHQLDVPENRVETLPRSSSFTSRFCLSLTLESNYLINVLCRNVAYKSVTLQRINALTLQPLHAVCTAGQRLFRDPGRADFGD